MAGIADLRALFGEQDREVSAERFLLTLVQVVRNSEVEDRSRRDVYVAARKRRRRLAVLSIGAGPLAGVANQLADLYCETAIVCDVSAIHGMGLRDEEIAAHMLVLWGLVEDHAEAVKAMAGEPPLARILAARLRDRVGEQMPDKLTKRSLTKALWDARASLGDARKEATTGAVTTAVSSGRRTKRLIDKAEGRLGVAQQRQGGRFGGLLRR